jgi:hypothetical protein
MSPLRVTSDGTALARYSHESRLYLPLGPRALEDRIVTLNRERPRFRRFAPPGVAPGSTVQSWDCTRRRHRRRMLSPGSAASRVPELRSAASAALDPASARCSMGSCRWRWLSARECFRRREQVGIDPSLRLMSCLTPGRTPPSTDHLARQIASDGKLSQKCERIRRHCPVRTQAHHRADGMGPADGLWDEKRAAACRLLYPRPCPRQRHLPSRRNRRRLYRERLAVLASR